MKIPDAIQEFILYKQSLGMSYRNRALKLNAFARFAGPVDIDSVSPVRTPPFLLEPESQRLQGQVKSRPELCCATTGGSIAPSAHLHIVEPFATVR